MSIDTPPLSPPTYREFAPPRALAGDLVCTWTLLVGAADHPQRVLPDACIDIVWIGENAPMIAGPATRLSIVQLPAGSQVVGVRFQPGSAPGLLGLPADLLTDREVPLLDAWKPPPLAGGGRGRGSPGGSLWVETPPPPAPPAGGGVKGDGAAAARLAVLGRALLGRLADAPPADGLVAAAVAWLARNADGRIERFCREEGISARQLRRRFTAMVGYGPKTFHRIVRFQRLLALAGRGHGTPLGLAALALRAGYADQAHMTREVTALSGRSPSAILPNAFSTLAMADFFKTTVEGAD
jgi:AraC-like DNA-binding protein